MDLELTKLIDKHCRFRLKNGNDVYGVLWTTSLTDQAELYFATGKQYATILEAKLLGNFCDLEKFKYPIQLDNFIDAECLN